MDDAYSCRGPGTQDKYLRLFPDGSLVGVVLDTPGILRGEMESFSYRVDHFISGSYTLGADGSLSMKIVRAGAESQVKATVDAGLDFYVGATQEHWVRLERLSREESAPFADAAAQYSVGSVDQAILLEWANRKRTREQAARDWEAGVLMYSRDGHLFEMAGAELMCSGLVAELEGRPVIPVGRLGDTLQNVLYGSLASLRNGLGYRHREQRLSRLALLVTKGVGWQPVELGGSGAHEQLDRYLRDPMEQMALMVAIGSTIQAFFGVSP